MEKSKTEKNEKNCQIFKISLNQFETNTHAKVMINISNKIYNYQICIKRKYTKCLDVVKTDVLYLNFYINKGLFKSKII